MRAVADDVFAASKRMREDWDEVLAASDAMDGAFLVTVCPDCGGHVNALVRDDDHPHVGLWCPQCHFEWTERR